MRATYRHLQSDLKRFMRESGIQPSRNACFQNCQRILLSAEDTPFASRLAYHEGWVMCSAGVPIAHAWLMLDNAVQDPTLADREPDDYLCSTTYTAEQIRESLLSSHLWKPIDERALTVLLFKHMELKIPG